VNLANAVNQLLWATVGRHKNPGFTCPECLKPCEPVMAPGATKAEKAKQKGNLPYFRHVKKSKCPGPSSWRHSGKKLK
jgi:hypothetical protein